MFGWHRNDNLTCSYFFRRFRISVLLMLISELSVFLFKDSDTQYISQMLIVYNCTYGFAGGPIHHNGSKN